MLSCALASTLVEQYKSNKEFMLLKIFLIILGGFFTEHRRIKFPSRKAFTTSFGWRLLGNNISRLPHPT
jgi:hypothetical protein